MNYYYLISGLRDLQAENAKSAPVADALLNEIRAELSADDAKLINLLLAQHDNSNLLRLLDDKNAELDPRGTLTATDWHELFEALDATETPDDKRLLPYVAQFLHTLNDEKAAAEITSKEDFLAALYYDFGSRCKNAFVAEWFTFCLNLNNILTAAICRKHGFDIKKAVIGNNEVAESLRSSNARDFGLIGQLDDAEKILALADEPNPLERERKTDALKWAWLDEHTFFNYFGIENVLAYWLRCELLHRWDNLDTETGKQIFRSLLDDMKKSVNFTE